MFQPLVSLKRQVILSNDTESVWESTCPNTEQFIKIENAMYKYFLICSWLYAVRPLPLTLRICLVADCGRFNCQTVVKFERVKNLAKCCKTAIRYMRCWQQVIVFLLRDYIYF